MELEIKEKLEKLVGKIKVYEKKEIKIKSFKNVRGTIVIFTNRNSHAFAPSEIDGFIESLQEPKTYTPKIMEPNKKTPVSETKSVTESSSITINGYQPTKESVILKNSLMDFLKEINTGEITDEKIKKGKLIYDVSTSIVNIQKTEIALINAVKK
ncbi:hypothetical protein Danklef1_68 [Polaribacter phage Danklef_1]|uniref:Uncharacterized protein n=1 Tax=Polaribacter phage Danklef_1 TaxID=2745646 RepID=A0A8E5EBL7_9CAUD|nr:hypothetical protein M1M23_gp68 [Polaribacter phage Danklef_1]QQV90628.1 hypothetical protein Danklef2_68 [Polaribacter phage Danklef_2]QQV90705.1 hypothetical protein Danklef3_69 [Polaribacter phage Danklef_3]QQV90782.1 hypothetical protein Danklef4_69 [Polaribacter phage Danklef_4]QQV90861.1 hypothetical protein Danklef5_70 [Polaribacter phage Danklef_5]QQV90552.1 hypothetical protein Danklef1_68 [Polaribacter phage Danklef_1]